jgi:hypothetical protein
MQQTATLVDRPDSARLRHACSICCMRQLLHASRCVEIQVDSGLFRVTGAIFLPFLAYRSEKKFLA